MTQSTRLFMVGQGILGDSPAVAIQPPLADGVHLRWAFRREMGFPWYGYFLFRRVAKDPRLTCVSLRDTRIGDTGSTILTTGVATVSATLPLVLRDDFPSAGVAEIDMAGQAHLTWSLPVDAYQVRASVGFRSARRLRRCLELDRVKFVGKIVHGQGFRIELTTSGAHMLRGAALAEVVARPDDLLRLEHVPFAGGATIHLDEPANEMSIGLAQVKDDRVRVTGLDSSGEVVAEAQSDGERLSGDLVEIVLRAERPIAAIRFETAGIGGDRAPVHRSDR